MDNKKLKLGILGGMGPLATSILFRLIVENTKSANDAGHIRIFIDNNPQIPDRTAAILSGGTDPVPAMVESAKNLERMGADRIMMPCNTAHFFLDRIQAEIDVKFINMIEQTALKLKADGIKKAGILCTVGTIKGNVYSKYLNREGIELLTPDEIQQKEVMNFIYNGVKAGNRSFDATEFQRITDSLYSRGAETIILGCTEIMPGMNMYGVKADKTDEPMEILARSAVKIAGYETV